MAAFRELSPPKIAISTTTKAQQICELHREDWSVRETCKSRHQERLSHHAAHTARDLGVEEHPALPPFLENLYRWRSFRTEFLKRDQDRDRTRDERGYQEKDIYPRQR